MATIADLLIKLGIQNEASAGLKTFERDVDSAGAHSKSFGNVAKEAHEGVVKSLGKVAVAAGIAGAAFEGAEFVKGGIEAAEGLQKAHEALATAIEHTGGNVEKLDPIMESTAKGAADYGISQEQATRSLAQATLMTGSAVAGQRAYTEAVLLSKGAHISFDAALRATAKGQNGVLSSLTRYGVVLKKGATGVQQLAAIQKVWGGQAEANTLDSDRLTAKFQNMQAALGSFLLPMFLKFADFMGKVIDGLVSLAHWVSKNSDIIAPLAAAIGAVVGAFVVWRTVTAAWTAVTELATAAQIALDAAMDANPIGLVILAIVGLGAALAVLWVKSESFREAVEAAWTTLKTTTMTVWNAIKDFLTKWWPVMLAIATGGVGLIVLAIVNKWDDIKLATSSAWNALKGIITGAIDAVRGAAVGGFDAMASAVTGAVNRIRSIVEAVFGGLAAIVKGAVKAVEGGIGALVGAFSPILDVLHSIESAANSAIGAIDRVVSAAGAVKGAVGGLLSHIPGFAGGVSNFGGGLAIVGENGPELVNLPAGSDVYTNAETRGMLGGFSPVGGGGDGDIVLVLDGDVLARFTRRELTRTGRRNVGLTFGGSAA
jgi:hypothetical protein